MTIVESERISENGEPEMGFCVGFQYDEEMQLADAVMRLLADPVFRGDDRDFLEQVYWEKRARYVPRLWAEELDRTMDVFETWSNPSRVDRADCAMPKFLDGNPDIDSNNSSVMNMGLDTNTINIILLTWQEAWKTHRDKLIQVSDSYREFAGAKQMKQRSMLARPQQYLDQATQAEDDFWKEVEKVKMNTADSGRFVLDWNDSYKYVLDYMSRGRDVIPRVLMHHWLEIEACLPEFIPHAVHPEEQWVLDAAQFSARQIAEFSRTSYTKEEKRILMSKDGSKGV